MSCLASCARARLAVPATLRPRVGENRKGPDAWSGMENGGRGAELPPWRWGPRAERRRGVDGLEAFPLSWCWSPSARLGPRVGAGRTRPGGRVYARTPRSSPPRGNHFV